jgi:cob(I)alamin adenosyltransferase
VSEKPFSDPKLAINRVYTRHGDAGETKLVGGQTVRKDELRIEAYGTVDELNAFVGVARASLEEATMALEAFEGGLEVEGVPENAVEGLEALDASLVRVQHELFNLGSLLATLPEDVHPKQPKITQAEIDLLEKEIDRHADLPPLRSFVLPGPNRLNADLHVCRTVCRRAERLTVSLAREQALDAMCVRYLNRLSDALFVWSRAANVLVGADETTWKPNEAASARGA